MNLERIQMRILTGQEYIIDIIKKLFSWLFYIEKDFSCDRTQVQIISFVLNYWSSTWYERHKSVYVSENSNFLWQNRIISSQLETENLLIFLLI